MENNRKISHKHKLRAPVAKIIDINIIPAVMLAFIQVCSSQKHNWTRKEINHPEELRIRCIKRVISPAKAVSVIGTYWNRLRHLILQYPVGARLSHTIGESPVIIRYGKYYPITESTFLV